MSFSRQNDPFAVSTPAPHPAGANLSPQERKIYEFMWQHREQPPSLSALIARNAPRWLVVGGALTFGIVIAFILDAALDGSLGSRDDGFDFKPYLFSAGVGLWFGVILRDYGQCKAVKQLWPLEAAVIDWPKVERLLWGAGESNDLSRATQVRDEAPLAAIPVDDESPRAEDRRR